MSQITFAEKSSAPDTPASGKAVLYFDSNGDLSWKNDAGSVVNLDYQTGTWTAVVSDASTSGNVATLTTNVCTYTKIGRQVTGTVNIVGINTTGMTASNQVFIQNFPFAANSTASYGSSWAVRLANVAFAAPAHIGLSAGSTVGGLVEMVSASTLIAIIVSDITSGAGATIRFSFSYETN